MIKNFLKLSYFLLLVSILGLWTAVSGRFYVKAYSNGLTEEKILLFESNIDIDTNTGKLHVIENIKVNAQNIDIVHGIFRDFPLVYKAKDTGETYKVKFKLISTKLDGQSVKNKTERIDRGIRIYLGDANTVVSKGIHIYTIEYETDKQMGFPKDLPNFVELYWNVNGTGWLFPIDKVVAKVKLPPGLSVDNIKYKAFTGKFGETGDAYRTYIKNGKLIFETTKPFKPGENLTISVLFPKEYINVKPNSIVNRFADNAGIFLAIIGFIIVSVLAYKTWQRIGKDPELGSIMPMFKPPENLDPVSIRYLYKLRSSWVDNKSLTAALVYLAVNGYIKILEPTRGQFKIELLKYPENKDSWEYEFTKNILSKEHPWELKRTVKTANKIMQAMSILKKHVKRLAKNLYDTNMNYIIPFWGLYIVILSVSLFVAYLNLELTQDNFMTLIVFGFTFGSVALGVFTSLRSKGMFEKNWLGLAIGLSFFAWLFLNISSSLWALIIALYIFAIMMLYELFPRFSEKGISLYREILGFKEYLETAEEDRLNFLNPPELTPQLFEKYLPYAMALEVEHKWAKKFEKIFKKLREQGQEYLTTWYNVGYNMTLNDRLVKLTDHISTSMASTITSAVRVSSASTGGFSGGFSGGGFSGGGGGGGGGGGW